MSSGSDGDQEAAEADLLGEGQDLMDLDEGEDNLLPAAPANNNDNEENDEEAEELVEEVEDPSFLLFDLFNSDDDDSESEYLPPGLMARPQINYSRGGRRLVNRLTLSPAVEQRQPSTSAGRLRLSVPASQYINSKNKNDGGEDSPKKRGRRRKATSPKKIVQKVKPTPKPPRPPKPLKPITIKRDFLKTAENTEDLESIRKNTMYKLNINFNSEKFDGFNCGKVRIIIPKPSTSTTTDSTSEDSNAILPSQFHKNDIHQIFPHLSTIQIIIMKHNRREFGGLRMRVGHFIQLTTIKVLNEEESLNVERPTGYKPEQVLFYEDSTVFLNECKFDGFDDYSYEEYFDIVQGFTSKKHFTLDFVNFLDGVMEFNLIFLKSGIIGAHKIDDTFTSRLPNAFLKHYLCIERLNISNANENIEQQKEDLAWFFGQIKKYHSNSAKTILNPSDMDISLQHPAMRPKLRNYQKQAVNWMLYKEGYFSNCNDNNNTDILDWMIQNIFTTLQLTNMMGEKEEIFYNKYANYFSIERPSCPSCPYGGLLADEMGLGKTVEILSLILLHQKPRPVDEVSNSEIVLSSDENYSSMSPDPEELKRIRKRRKKLKRRRSPSPFEFKAGVDDEVEQKVVIEFDKGKNDKNDELISYELDQQPGPSTSTSNLSQIIDIKEEIDVKGNSIEDSGSVTKTKLKKGRKKVIQEEDIKPESEQNVIENDEDKPLQLIPKKRGKKNSIQKSKEIEQTEDVLPESGPGELMSDKNDDDDNEIQMILPRKRSRKLIIDDDDDVETECKKKESTYDRVKYTYLNSLKEYESAKYAQVQPRFFGEFYNTHIKMKSYFECFCGEGLEEMEDIVTCTKCSSSQHASCVKYNRKKDPIYLCPHCVITEVNLPIKATLIVAPASIAYQWIDEIKKHVCNQELKILYYKGVSEHGYMNPSEFSEYDIILTTYNVLSNELHYTELPHNNSELGRRLRNPKRFLTVPSTLTCITYWRIVTDECQMIENVNASMSIMAKKLKGINRWTVTGTPINKSIKDLHGLFSFLDISPISLEFYWDALVSNAFYKKDDSFLYKLFGTFIWRTGKFDVLDQLGIPPQKEIIHWLNFSPVEGHFYKREFKNAAQKIIEKIAKLKLNEKTTRISSLDRKTLQSILKPFIELRKSCNHPSITKGIKISLNAGGSKSTMTMEELLESLIKKTSIECAEDQRLIIAALNGMAGCYILKEDYVQASEMYREVLQLANKNSSKFKADSLQMLHTYENLSYLINGNYKIPHTLRDDEIKSEALKIRHSYLEKYIVGIKSGYEMVELRTKNVEEYASGFKMIEDSWWTTALYQVVKKSLDRDLIEKIKSDLIEETASKKEKKNPNSLANKFNDVNSLIHAMTGNIMLITSLRESVINSLEVLRAKDANSFVESAIWCHLRNQSAPNSQCELCTFHDQFLTYEHALYNFDKNSKIIRTGRNFQKNKILGSLPEDMTEEEKQILLLKEEEALIENTGHVNMNLIVKNKYGNWLDSDTEKVLKTILNYVRTHLDGSSSTIKSIKEDGKNHLGLFMSWRKEFPFLRIFWRQIYDQVSGIDEISQASTRLRLNYEGEEIPGTSHTNLDKNIKSLTSGIEEKTLKIQNIHVLGAHEIDAKLIEMRADLLSGKESLAIHMGQYMYLVNLKNNGYGKKGSKNEEECPVCRMELGHKWVTLQCGHSFCLECQKKMCNNSFVKFTCPLCRLTMKSSEIFIVDTTIEEDENLPIEGPSQSEIREFEKEYFKRYSKKAVIGSHSTKIEAVVQTLSSLSENHLGEKVIIFSTWIEVLEILARALDQNAIKYVSTLSSKKLHKSLNIFKTSPDIQVLLMPLSSGSKGLNIIEASHIFLVEPILNIAAELQAIGRVHRIGQTKNTYVHKFYIRETIEEKLFKILKTHDVNSDDSGSLTLADLRSLVSTSISVGSSEIEPSTSSSSN